jgi:SAM-dependent methyltransferase
MDTIFDAYSRYYDILYQDKNYLAEVVYIRSLLARHGVIAGDLLELGSGTGKHAQLLVKYGYIVDGIERSAEMIARIPVMRGFSCQQGDIRSFHMEHSYDAVLSLFHVLSYQASNQDVLAVFTRAAEHLKPGGIFVFDFWYSPAVYTQKPMTRVKRMFDEQSEVTRIAEPHIFPNENRVDINYTIYAKERVSDSIQTFSELHSMRHFSLPEIDLFADAAGLKRVSAEEFLTGNEPSEMTWGVCVTLQKS